MNIHQERQNKIDALIAKLKEDRKLDDLDKSELRMLIKKTGYDADLIVTEYLGIKKKHPVAITIVILFILFLLLVINYLIASTQNYEGAQKTVQPTQTAQPTPIAQPVKTIQVAPTIQPTQSTPSVQRIDVTDNSTNDYIRKSESELREAVKNAGSNIERNKIEVPDYTETDCTSTYSGIKCKSTSY